MSISKPDVCKACVGWSWGCSGFVPSTGDGPVLLLGEAAGAEEAEAGQGFIGKSGYYLFSNLARVGIDREQFTIANIISCRPPDNKLAGMPYEQSVIASCSPILDATVVAYKKRCAERKTTPVILALGLTAFKRCLNLKPGDAILKEDYYGYMHWSPTFDCWCVAAPHPAYLLRGQHQYLPCLQFAAKRALEVSKDGFAYDTPRLLLDPLPQDFKVWVDEYFRALSVDAGTYLSVDIETPKKSKNGEDELVREDEEDYIILRCSFAYRTDSAVSVPWTAEYMPMLEAIFAEPRNQIVGWNLAYDIPRIKHQIPVKGTLNDGMLFWHVLHSSLDKRLGFVSAYYNQRGQMWKHLAQREPAYYNALDSLRALINTLGIKQDLVKAGQWHVVERHVIKLQQILNAMSAAGLLRDEVMRAKAETDLTTLLQDTEAQIQAVVPDAAKKLKVYSTKPRDLTGVKVRTTQRPVTRCIGCGLVKPPKAHGKVFKKKINPCANLGTITRDEPCDQFYRELEWKPSKTQLTLYQGALKQRAVWNRQKGTTTFDENAIRALKQQYPKDPLYPLILNHRKYQKLRGTYIGITQPSGIIKGGLNIGRDGRIHPEFTMNPSTLRLACQNPNAQNLPAARTGSLEAVVRNLIMAAPGCLLLEADYAAIESVLTSYFARWPDGIRLAKVGVHAYLASHVLGRPADLTWPDTDLAAYLKEIKASKDAEIQRIYNACKRCVHGSNYGMSPRKMVMSEPDTFPDEKYARRIQDTYFEVASPIRKWHIQTQMEAHQAGFLTNPFGYKLHLHHVFHNVLEDGEWVRKPGEQANEALAFLPQSTAAAILKEAMIRLYFNRFEEVGQYLRLQVHDSLVSEVPVGKLDEVRAVKRQEMTRPIPELPLPASYNLGDFLVIDVDTKSGERWGSLS